MNATPPVDQLADEAVFARELRFIRDASILAVLTASGVIMAGEHASLYERLAGVCQPVYQRRKLSGLTG